MAAALLALGLLAVIGSFTGTLKLMARSQEMTESAEVAREFLERTKGMGFGLVPPGANFDGQVPTAQTAQGFPPAPYPTTTRNGRTYTLAVRTHLKQAGLVSVQVEVRWQPNHRTSMETYLHP